VPSILRKMNLAPAKVSTDARALLRTQPQAYGADVRLSPRMKLIFDSAEAEAKRLQDEYVSTEHLLVALATEVGRSPASQLLQRAGVTKDALYAALTQVRGNQRVTSQNPEATYEALARYGLTVEEAQEHGIDAFEIARDFASTGRGQTIEGARGHLTAVVDRERKRLVGEFAACPGAGELIHEAVLAMKLDAPLSVLADTIHAFPTSARVMGGVYQEAAQQMA